jgi:hypothetical protein
VAATAFACLPQAAGASTETGPHATLSAAFRPLRLGAATTISFDLEISPPVAGAAAPVSAIEVSYPSDLGLLTSGLGVQSCDPQALQSEGTGACPPDSKMGQGSALVEVPFGPLLVFEHVRLTIFAAPSTDGFVHLAILAHGKEPVIASIVLSAVLLPGRLKIVVPAIGSLPGAPYAALRSMRASLGGPLTYYERVGDRVIAYRPRGIGLPDSCPRGGWKLAGDLLFLDGRQTRAATRVHCP